MTRSSCACARPAHLPHRRGVLFRALVVAGDHERGLQRPEGSYVVTLLDDPALAARKVGEEGLEAALAGAGESDQRLVEELADLWFHSYALLAARGLDPRLVEEELGRRAGRALREPFGAFHRLLGRPASLVGWIPNPPGSRRHALERRQRRSCSPPGQPRSSWPCSSASA